MSEKETVKVAFVKDKDNNEIVAVFPEIEWSHFGKDVQMYAHFGQHSEGSLDWAREQEKPSADEIVDLYNELRDIGYDIIMVTL